MLLFIFCGCVCVIEINGFISDPTFSLLHVIYMQKDFAYHTKIGPLLKWRLSLILITIL